MLTGIDGPASPRTADAAHTPRHPAPHLVQGQPCWLQPHPLSLPPTGVSQHRHPALTGVSQHHPKITGVFQHHHPTRMLRRMRPVKQQRRQLPLTAPQWAVSAVDLCSTPFLQVTNGAATAPLPVSSCCCWRPPPPPACSSDEASLLGPPAQGRRAAAAQAQERAKHGRCTTL